jgi:hypothetical protein
LTWTNDGIRDLAKRYRVRDIYGRGRSVNWLDYDTDGDLDLYVGNWAREGHPSVLFSNRRNGFHRARAGVADQLRTISSSWADWDRDGDPDLLVMQFAAPTVAYENTRGRFARVSLSGVTGGHWYSAAWGDYNGDGFTDLHVVGETEAIVFKNVRGRFRAVHTTPVRDGRMSVWLDLNNDTDLDLFVVQGAPGVSPNRGTVNEPDFLLVRRGGRFVKLISESMRGRRRGSGDTATAADFNRDGRMDLLVTNGYFEYEQWRGESSLLRNPNKARGWVAVDLDAGRWNPLGIGAKLHVRTSLFEYRRELTDGVTFRGQSEVSHALLGIGRAQWAKVTVQWTDGTRDCFLSILRSCVRLPPGIRG